MRPMIAFLKTFLLHLASVKINNSMRNLLLSLSAVLFLSIVACKPNDSEKTVRSMSASVQRTSADSPFTWNAAAALVVSEIPFNNSVRFKGSEYIKNPTSMNMFINNYKGKGIYKLYQGSAQQTDSNSVKLTYAGREYSSIQGTVNVLEDNAEYYIARFSFTGKNLNDTIIVNHGAFTIAK